MAPSRKRSREHSEAAESDSKSPRRVATVYDAVAGRVGYEAFLGEPKTSRYRDTKSSTSQAVPAEEVLFRREGAPMRYAENDGYFANEQLGTDQKLPDSDLLKHLHAYASDFYRSATSSGGKEDWRSMDETALLALGILMEETAAELLGETGDLALVEGDDCNGATGSIQSSLSFWDGHSWTRSVLNRPPPEHFSNMITARGPSDTGLQASESRNDTVASGDRPSVQR